MTTPICPYCEVPAVLSDASVIYGPTYEGRFNLWVCSSGCDAYVGVAPGMIPYPAGTLANPELRALRKRLRGKIDADLETVQPRKGCSRYQQEINRMRRVNLLEIKVLIGRMTEDQCRKSLMALIQNEEREAQQA